MSLSIQRLPNKPRSQTTTTQMIRSNKQNIHWLPITNQSGPIGRPIDLCGCLGHKGPKLLLLKFIFWSRVARAYRRLCYNIYILNSIFWSKVSVRYNICFIEVRTDSSPTPHWEKQWVNTPWCMHSCRCLSTITLNSLKWFFPLHRHNWSIHKLAEPHHNP